MTYTLHTGDCRDVMATIPSESVDAIVCDPPYELGFMEKTWDNSGIAYDVTVWRQCLRVLKPGGHLIAFGGSRTYHRLAVAVEDAGFEIRDQIQWIYGSGFPKSLDISKAMDKQAGAAPQSPNAGKWKPSSSGAAPMHGTGWGTEPTVPHNWAPSTDLAKQWHGWGTALKPAHEPAVLARKPLRGTVADTVAQWGTGALNIDGTRVATDDNLGGDSYGGVFSGSRDEHGNLPKAIGSGDKGRWPSNVILDEEAARLLGDRARFFYVAKASKAEREAGLDGVQARKAGGMDGRHSGTLVGNIVYRANHHPTVKPLALMRYLVRMVTPPGGVVLDPFMGSGSTGCAAVREGFDFVGIELTPEYVDIAERRIDWHAVTSPLDGNVIMNAEENDA